MKKVFIGGDHAGFDLKAKVIDRLEGQGYSIRDFGTKSSRNRGSATRVWRSESSSRGPESISAGHGSWDGARAGERKKKWWRPVPGRRRLSAFGRQRLGAREA